MGASRVKMYCDEIVISDTKNTDGEPRNDPLFFSLSFFFYFPNAKSSGERSLYAKRATHWQGGDPHATNKNVG